MVEWNESYSKEYCRKYWYSQGQNSYTYLNPFVEESVMKGWSKQFSKTYCREYWHNMYTNEVCWILPENANLKSRVAIVVPFRDLHPEQSRAAQLKRFVAEMTDYMNGAFVPFKIFIIEQSNDNKKFNRGKLLNIGFKLGLQQEFNTFIFHDVDLLPSINLMNYYRNGPIKDSPVHLARVWNRYNNNPKYFGGIVSFSTSQFQCINGFPNNYWGWGGEDDELMLRVKEVCIHTFPLCSIKIAYYILICICIMICNRSD